MTVTGLSEARSAIPFFNYMVDIDTTTRKFATPTPPGPTRPSESTRHAAARGLAPRPTHTPPSTPNRAFCPPCSAAREPPCGPPARTGLAAPFGVDPTVRRAVRTLRAYPRPSVDSQRDDIPRYSMRLHLLRAARRLGRNVTIFARRA